MIVVDSISKVIVRFLNQQQQQKKKALGIQSWMMRSSSSLRNSSSSTIQSGRQNDLLLPDRILSSALVHLPRFGFSSRTIEEVINSEPELYGNLKPSMIFPSLTSSTQRMMMMMTSSQKKKKKKEDRMMIDQESIGPSKALAQRWIEEANEQMKLQIIQEGLSLQKHGLIMAVKRAFEIRLDYNRSIDRQDLLHALALIVTPGQPFFGFRLPLKIEPPHLIPYASHALNVATVALAGLKDYSKSREWMLRRIRLGGVYATMELMSLGADDRQPRWVISNLLEELLNASETVASNIGDTLEFITYVRRSQRAIIQSLGLL